jgi:hypothetical protein
LFLGSLSDSSTTTPSSLFYGAHTHLNFFFCLFFFPIKMYYSLLLKVAATAGLLHTAFAAKLVRDDSGQVDTLSSQPACCTLEWSDVASLQTTYYKGNKYGCKCYPGQSCWPSARSWSGLNQTVDGSLLVHIPPGAACHNTFAGPLGNVSTYNAAACVAATTGWPDETWTYDNNNPPGTI